jgi:hypothetical protein
LQRAEEKRQNSLEHKKRALQELGNKQNKILNEYKNKLDQDKSKLLDKIQEDFDKHAQRR